MLKIPIIVALVLSGLSKTYSGSSTLVNKMMAIIIAKIIVTIDMPPPTAASHPITKPPVSNLQQQRKLFTVGNFMFNFDLQDLQLFE